MATVPTEVTAVAGSVLTAAMWNSNVRDATNFLLAPPTCEVYQTIAQSVPNGGAPLLFDSEVVDTDNMHSTSSNTSRITAQTAGRYQTGGGGEFTSNSTGMRGSWMRRNGADEPATEMVFGANSAGQSGVPLRNRTIYLNLGDYIEMVGYQNIGGALSTATSFVAQYATFFARYIGTT